MGKDVITKSNITGWVITIILSISGSIGAATCDTSIATAKGWTVTI